MTISRTSIIMTHILYIIGLGCLTAALLIRPATVVCPVLFLIFILSNIALIASTRCPHCRRFGLKPRPFAKNAGYCNYCGKLIGYDEQK